MNSALDILFLRRPSLRYVSPGVCEASFSGSGAPIIVLDALARGLGPTGLVLGGTGGFRLSWNNYPGALCFSVYKAVDELDPFGAYVLIAECITDNFIDLDSFGPGTYRVTAITEEGESDPSPPIKVEGAGSVVVTVVANPDITVAGDDFVGAFVISKEGFHNTDLVVNFVLSGDAVEGTDYTPICCTATILVGQEFVIVPVQSFFFEADTYPKTVVLTLAPGGFYFVGVPDTATVNIVAPEHCGTPVECWVPTIPGDAVPSCDEAILETTEEPPFQKVFLSGGNAHSQGTILFCGGPEGCTFNLFLQGLQQGTSIPAPRSVTFLVDGNSIIVNQDPAEFDGFWSQNFCGSATLVLGPDECVDVFVNVSECFSDLGGSWNLNQQHDNVPPFGCPTP